MSFSGLSICGHDMYQLSWSVILVKEFFLLVDEGVVRG